MRRRPDRRTPKPKEAFRRDHSTEQEIANAIRQKRLIQFTYRRDGLVRVAEPHKLGIQEGRGQVLLYQLRKGIEQREEWRRCHVDLISQLQVLEETFRGPRDENPFTESPFDQVLAVVRR